MQAEFSPFFVLSLSILWINEFSQRKVKNKAKENKGHRTKPDDSETSLVQDGNESDPRGCWCQSKWLHRRRAPISLVGE